jgi:hypothetical protein
MICNMSYYCNNIVFLLSCLYADGLSSQVDCTIESYWIRFKLYEEKQFPTKAYVWAVWIA